ncbi:MAG: archaeal proteasome endopeptidase complex subunit alpha [Candidatus Bathyarchaeia archaeon]|jgi:proteasome alpha subunit
MSVFGKPGAYDYNATVFSPDGRLFQVEYAMELVNRGATVLGIKCSEGVVLCSEEIIETLEKAEFSWKIFKLDEHIAAAIVGLSSDARVLIEKARVDCQSNKLTYDELIDVEVITEHISDIQQVYTQHGGGRPFGAALIIGGVDKTGPHLFGTHPSGTYKAYKATALGEGREAVLAVLKDEYREDLTLEDSLKLGVKCLLKTLKDRQLPLRIKIAVVPASTKKFEMLSDEAVQNRIREVS